MVTIVYILLMILTQHQVIVATAPAQCRVWGNSHITSFPANEADSTREVSCQQTGWIWLMKNQYVHSSIFIGSSPFYIHDFNFTLFDDAGLVGCTINGKDVVEESSITCSNPEIEMSFTNTTVTIAYKKANFLALIVVDDSTIPAFSITVWLESSLVKVSDGLCNTGCEKISTQLITDADHSSPITPRFGADKKHDTIQLNAKKICGIYIQQALKNLKLSAASKTKSRQVIETANSKSACITDLTLTGDIRVAGVSIFGLYLYKLTLNATSIETLKTSLTNGLGQALAFNSVIFLEATSKINRMTFSNHPMNTPAIIMKSGAATAVTTEKIMANYEAAYPSDTFVIHKYTAPGGSASFNGYLLLNIQLADNDWLDVYQLSKSTGTNRKSEDIRKKAYASIYRTKSEPDNNLRRDSIKNSLKTIFPNHYVNVFIFNSGWSGIMRNHKGYETFIKNYGSDVHIVLN